MSTLKVKSGSRSGAWAGDNSIAHLEDPGRRRGEWDGKGSRRVELGRWIKGESYGNLREGYSPSGEFKVARNAGDPDRIQEFGIGNDLPKSVSILYHFSPDWAKEEILNACRAGCRAQTEYLEAELPLARSGRGGRQKERGDLFIADFTHFNSRAGDPHLHIHRHILNLALTDNGSFTSIDQRWLYFKSNLLRSIFLVEVAKELQTRLGVEVEADGMSFRVLGVPKDLCRELSSRSNDIKEKMRKGKSEYFVSMETRPKHQEFSIKDLMARWQEVGAKYGFGPEQVRTLLLNKTQHKSHARSFSEAYKEGVNNLPPEKRTRKKRLEIATSLAIAHGAHARDLVEAVEPPGSKRFIRVEWRYVVPKAPDWSPLKPIKAPTIAIGEKNFPIRWGKILSKKSLRIEEIRAQERRLFPKAPKWSPLHKLKAPAIRVVGQPLLQITSKPLFKDSKSKFLSALKRPALKIAKRGGLTEWQREKWKLKLGRNESARRDESYRRNRAEIINERKKEKGK